MKKLKFFICFAAVLFLTTQFAVAQKFGTDPTSELKTQALRLNTDVDLYHSVNDWADVGVTKWFSFLQMGDINSTGTPVWEGGLALQMSKVFIATYYNGQFNDGSENQGKETIDLLTGEAWNGVDIDSGLPTDTLKHYNYFGVMVGVGGHGFKFSLRDELTTSDTQIFTKVGYTGLNHKGNSETTAPGAIGKYLDRNGRVIPKLQWGAAKDMTFGKYASRPNASFALDINFTETLLDLTDPDGTVHNFGDYNSNKLTPIVEFDTNGINFIPKAEWGNLTFGAVETFFFTVNGEGNQKDVPWGNKFTPYAKFSYQPVSYFRLATRLWVPVHLGWNGVDDYYFGIGARGRNAYGVSSDDQVTYGAASDWAQLQSGFQLGLGFIDEISGKPSLLERFKLNWGIKVNLPAYAVIGKVHEYKNDPADPNKVTDIEQDKASIWFPKTVLQSFTAGITFNITDKILLDAGFDLKNMNWKKWGLAESVTLGRVLISIKH